MFLLKMKKCISEKDLSNILFERIIWQLSGGSCLEGNYPGDNYPGADCPGTIFLGSLSGGNIILGSNCRGGAIVLKPRLWAQLN